MNLTSLFHLGKARMTPENDPASPAVKPAYKTTEFWLQTLAIALSTLLESEAFATDDPWSKRVLQASLILGSLGYTAARTSVKKKGIEGATAVAMAKEVGLNAARELPVPTKPSEPK